MLLGVTRKVSFLHHNINAVIIKFSFTDIYSCVVVVPYWLARLWSRLWTSKLQVHNIG